MNTIGVKIKLLRNGAVLPEYATEGSAALDLRCAADAPMTIAAGARALIPTGIALEPQSNDAVAVVCARSGLSSKHGIALANGIGVVDSDYRGEIMVSVINHGTEAYTIQPGERIAQLMFIPVLHARIIQTETLSQTDRGAGGFGSTGTN